MEQESEDNETIIESLESFFNSSNLNDLEKVISIYNADETQQINIENKILSTINNLFQGCSYNIEDVKKFLIIYDGFSSLNQNNFLYRNLVEIAVGINEKEVFDKCFEKIIDFRDQNDLFSNNHLNIITEKFQDLINQLKKFNVIVGTFSITTNANGLKNSLKSDGYNAFTVQNAKGWYRVVAASFDTREAATSFREAIKQRYAGKFDDAWLLVNE